MGTWFRGERGSAGLVDGFDDLRGLFPPKYSMIPEPRAHHLHNPIYAKSSMSLVPELLTLRLYPISGVLPNILL